MDHSLPLTDLHSVLATFTELKERLSESALGFRDPPSPPTTCCGKGCPGCVWISFYAAAEYWREQVIEQLEMSAATHSAEG